MPLLGSLLSKGIKLTHLIEQDKRTPFEYQNNELKKLIKEARLTHFGQNYNFNEILSSFEKGSSNYFYEYFRSRVPVFDYNKLYNEWWYRSIAGESDVCWPGQVKYFALSSGTSDASTSGRTVMRMPELGTSAASGVAATSAGRVPAIS